MENQLTFVVIDTRRLDIFGPFPDYATAERFAKYWTAETGDGFVVKALNKP